VTAPDIERPKTLRDEMAMAALSGLVILNGHGFDPADVAEDAWLIADAMMTARASGED
jgi:hypothetical protein